MIVGRVTAVRPYWADDPRRIESEVTFEQVEYLKGARPDSADAFSLIVPGGTVGTTRMTVCCAPEFTVGDKWLLCLLPTYKTYPVIGLYQGAFLIRPDVDGVERVVHRRHGREEPIAGIAANGYIRHSRKSSGSAHDHLLAATNVRLLAGPTQSDTAEAISYEDFVAQLRPVLAASHDHQLTQPAGRRVLVDYTAVPLRRSEFQRATDRAKTESSEQQTGKQESTGWKPVPQRGPQRAPRGENSTPEVTDTPRAAGKGVQP